MDNNIDNFKAAHERFTKALKYISNKNEGLRNDPKRWAKIKLNFTERFEKPLDSAWDALTKEEKKKFSSIYLHKKVIQEEIVQKALKVFSGTVIAIEE